MYEQVIPHRINRFDPDARLELTENVIHFEIQVGVDADFEIREDITVLRVVDTLRWIPPTEAYDGFVVRVVQGSAIDPSDETLTPHDVGSAAEIDLKTLPETQNAAGEV